MLTQIPTQIPIQVPIWIPTDTEFSISTDTEYTDPGVDLSTYPDIHSYTDLGTDPDTESGTDPDTYPGVDSGTDPDTDPHTDPDTHSDIDPDIDPGTDLDTHSHTDPDIDPYTDPGTHSDTDSDTDPGTDPGVFLDGSWDQLTGVSGPDPEDSYFIHITSLISGPLEQTSRSRRRPIGTPESSQNKDKTQSQSVNMLLGYSCSSIKNDTKYLRIPRLLQEGSGPSLPPPTFNLQPKWVVEEIGLVEP